MNSLFGHIGRSLLFLLLVPITLQGVAQKGGSKGFEVEKGKTPRMGFFDPDSLGKWNVHLDKARLDPEEESSEALQRIKERKNAKKEAWYGRNSGTRAMEEEISDSSFLQVVKRSHGNPQHRSEVPDSHFGISDPGYIVATVNSNVMFLDTSGSILTPPFKLEDMFSSVSYGVGDPQVLYDHRKDRFVLGSYGPGIHYQMLAFSKSSDPRDGWYTYKLLSDPIDTFSGNWDYPKLGIFRGDLVVTSNFVPHDSVKNHPRAFHIALEDGYRGDSLEWSYYMEIDTPMNNFVQGLQPVRSPYEKKSEYPIRLLHSDPSHQSHLLMVEISDSLKGSPSLDTQWVDVPYYHVQGHAEQKGSNSQLDTWGPEVYDAFILDEKVHYVQSVGDTDGFTRLRYGKIDPRADTLIEHKEYGEKGFDLAYPSIAPIGDSGDLLISYLKSGDSIYPRMEAILLRENEGWADPLVVRKGRSSVGSTYRWGDYSDIQRYRGLEGDRVWVYGHSGFSGRWRNTLAAIEKKPSEKKDEESQDGPDPFSLYPNPSVQRANLKFQVKGQGELNIHLYDSRGRVVKKLYRGEAQKGSHRLTFNVHFLDAGTYILKGVQEGNEGKLFSKKLIVH